MDEYMSKEDYCEINCGKENREGYKTCKNCGMLNVPAADVQPVKWISCKERMPEDNDRVLILAKNESVYIAKHRVFGHFVVSFEYWLDDTEVTHWMPLPEPPKDGDTP